ncbi:Putative DNA ligase-like protein/MT0965 (plasmid) [Variovorax sp. PBS-H4]|nr:Putative DNA ligase-like protein/MT0965 [Variovorax sp. PBS-H4]
MTSGSKGLHLYVPMDPPIPSAAAAEWARTIADTLVKDMPHLVTATMTRAVRAGKVFLDWSQNNGGKTTIAPYSLRGREHPTVAAPRAWDELDDPDLQHLTFRQVLDRVAAGRNPAVTLNTPPAPAPPEPPPAPDITVAATSVQSAELPATNDGQRLVEGLGGPVTVALAKARDDIPPARALPGGCVYELKWDGYRAAIVIDHRGSRIWSRQGTDLTDKFPEITAPAAQLPAGTVLDGELVIYNGARLDFDLLQRRMATSPAKIDDLVRAYPASFMVFDLLATDGLDLRARPFTERRHQLEHLTDWAPPLQLSPTTTDRDEAVRWMELYRPAGIEGIVSKGQTSPYRPGVRDWIRPSPATPKKSSSAASSARSTNRTS